MKIPLPLFQLSRPILRLVCCVIITVVACKPHSASNQIIQNRGEGIEPEKALASFELEPGFKIELLASEPLISDPVDMEIDEYGRLYVVEMHGYPLDKSGTGIIRLLSDSNGDGRMDKSIVYADHLMLPNSIMRWKNGLLVTDAPNVLYLEDTNGDGMSDVRDTLLTGFALSNPQHNLNSPLLGIDNWIYLAHEGAVATQTYKNEFGDTGTVIYYPGQPQLPVLPPNASGRSVRFRPDQHLLETTSANTQFGHSFNAWGDHFLVTNWNHSIQEVLEAGYLKRNPHLLVADATQSLSDHSDAAEVFPITRDPQMQLLTDVGVITSACGITSYTGGAFPSPFDQANFVAEPVSNLVHADRLSAQGASYVASRIHPHTEFLASTDAWFRPVNMYIGPDGALYIVDYYRQIIEHPEWMSDEVVRSGQLYNGHDKGRIYRISQAGSKPAGWTKGITLGKATLDELCGQLSNPNSWWRMNAQRLLVDRKDSSAIPKLEAIIRKSPSPLARLHALWTLEGMAALKPDLIILGLKDTEAGVRRNAIKLAEGNFAKEPGLEKALMNMSDDPDPKVRFQLLCTMGSLQSPDVAVLRNKMLFRDIRDPWVQVAALSASASQTGSLLKMVLDSFNDQNPAHASLVQRLGNMLAAGEAPASIHSWIVKATSATTGEWRAALLQGLAQGMKNRKPFPLTSADRTLLVRTFFQDTAARMRTAALAMLKVVRLPDEHLRKQAVSQALAIIRNEKHGLENRTAALQFLSLDNPGAYAQILHDLIRPNQPVSMQITAIKVLNSIPDTVASHILLQRWAALTPEVQDEAINLFLSDTARIKLLLHSMENGTVQTSSIGWPRSVRLMNHRNIRLREKARELLTKNEKDRVKVNQEYQDVLTLTGDAENGKQVFLQQCYTCHQVRGTMGMAFGPDLGTVHNWPADAIMANILNPNLSISSGFDLWSVELGTGESLQGVISSETATSITLKNAGREIRTINRSEIKSLKALNASSMPSGFEQKINHQQMADLIAFLKANK